MSEKTTYELIDRTDSELANFLLGRLATLADASMENERQAQAFKDLLKSIIWENETTRSTSIRRILYSCRKAKVPTFPDWLEKQVAIELGDS